ncbi:hypothetical protein HWV62_38524 [Athelia sp. TMB]|nr:hypothetical protein HWV62_38524 [Athelia sp. TMB]
MCYTAHQKYKECRVFRTHYINRDIQCEEMQMWSKLFKKQVWCRAIYQTGIQALSDEAQLAALTKGSHFPAPPADVPVPARLVCHRCRGPQIKAGRAHRAHKSRRTDGDEKKTRGLGTMIQRQTLAVRRLWSENVAPRTFELVSRCA